MQAERNSSIVYDALLHHLEKEDPLLYNSLPGTVQKDRLIARAAIRGSMGLIEQNADTLKNEDEQYQPYCSLIESLCENQPEALFKEIGRFRMALEPIGDACFSYDSLQLLNNRRVDDIVYRELVLILVMDISQIIGWQEYVGLLDSMKRDDRVISRILYDSPSVELFRAIPLDHLREEHYIFATVSYFYKGLCEEDGTPLRLDNIPERFAKARKLYANLGLPQNAGRNRRFSIPPELNTDRDFCLACLRGARGQYDLYTDKLWKSIPRGFRNDHQFLSEAVIYNFNALHSYWKFASVQETPFNVMLYSIKSHGYRTTLKSSQVSDQKDLADSFDQKLKSELDRYDEFQTFLGGIVQARRENSSCPLLRKIDFGDEATGTSIKMNIASYAGVPIGKYLADLREVWIIRSQYQDALKGMGVTHLIKGY